jgi:hypothetical protein
VPVAEQREENRQQKNCEAANNDALRRPMSRARSTRLIMLHRARTKETLGSSLATCQTPKTTGENGWLSSKLEIIDLGRDLLLFLSVRSRPENKPLRMGDRLKFYTAKLSPTPHSPEVRNHPSFAWVRLQYK